MRSPAAVRVAGRNTLVIMAKRPRLVKRAGAPGPRWRVGSARSAITGCTKLVQVDLTIDSGRAVYITDRESTPMDTWTVNRQFSDAKPSAACPCELLDTLVRAIRSQQVRTASLGDTARDHDTATRTRGAVRCGLAATARRITTRKLRQQQGSRTHSGGEGRSHPGHSRVRSARSGTKRDWFCRLANAREVSTRVPQ